MNRLMRNGIKATLFMLIILAAQAQVSQLQAAPINSIALTAVVQPPCTETEFNTAFNVIQSSGGGTITFNCGGPTTILVLSLKNVTQNTVIDGGGVITITGGLATPLFHATAPASLMMRNIILDSAYNTNSSGGAIWSSGPLTLTNVTIQNSQTGPSPYCGGALVVAGNTYITHSTFNSNIAVLGGGAICVRSQPGTKVQITDSYFSGNQSLDATNGHGGALYVEYGTATVLDSLFMFNSAHFGGAVYALYDNATVTLEGSATSTPPYASGLQFNANSATEDGGAIYNSAGTMTIKNAVVSANRTPTQTLLAGYGGAIHNEGVLTLTNSIVSSNQGRYGGGVFVGNNSTTGARAVLDRVFLYNNVSGNLGGGLYTNIVTTTITISNSAFRGNTAATGGGLARNNAALNIFNSSFTYNTATYGGGLFLSAVPYSYSGPYVRVQSVTVSDNTATSNLGGGLYNTSRVELYSMTIVTNTSGVFSGNSGNTRFRDTVLQNPSSLNCDGDGTASISDDAKNFSTDNSCVLPSSQTGIGLNPKLGPLTLDPIGGTSYHLPLAGSPLINGGFNCPSHDQRGATRVGACDIGAVEYIPPVYLPLVVK